jgi:hypothetical protein
MYQIWKSGVVIAKLSSPQSKIGNNIDLPIQAAPAVDYSHAVWGLMGCSGPAQQRILPRYQFYDHISTLLLVNRASAQALAFLNFTEGVPGSNLSPITTIPYDVAPSFSQSLQTNFGVKRPTAIGWRAFLSTSLPNRRLLAILPLDAQHLDALKTLLHKPQINK